MKAPSGLVGPCGLLALLLVLLLAPPPALAADAGDERSNVFVIRFAGVTAPDEAAIDALIKASPVGMSFSYHLPGVIPEGSDTPIDAGWGVFMLHDFNDMPKAAEFFGQVGVTNQAAGLRPSAVSGGTAVNPLLIVAGAHRCARLMSA